MSTVNRGKDCEKETLQKESKNKSGDNWVFGVTAKALFFLIILPGHNMIAKTKPGSLLLGLSIIMVTTVYGDIRCLYIFDGGLLKKIICVSLVCICTSLLHIQTWPALPWS